MREGFKRGLRGGQLAWSVEKAMKMGWLGEEERRRIGGEEKNKNNNLILFYPVNLTSPNQFSKFL